MLICCFLSLLVYFHFHSSLYLVCLSLVYFVLCSYCSHLCSALLLYSSVLYSLLLFIHFYILLYLYLFVVLSFASLFLHPIVLSSSFLSSLIRLSCSSRYITFFKLFIILVLCFDPSLYLFRSIIVMRASLLFYLSLCLCWCFIWACLTFPQAFFYLVIYASFNFCYAMLLFSLPYVFVFCHLFLFFLVVSVLRLCFIFRFCFRSNSVSSVLHLCFTYVYLIFIPTAFFHIYTLVSHLCSFVFVRYFRFLWYSVIF